jgi:hypothetical protein
MNEPSENNEVSEPSSSDTKSKRQKVTDHTIDGSNDLETADILLAPFPMRAVNKMFRYSFTPNGRDPRVTKLEEGQKLSIDSCPFCTCNIKYCHEKRYGLYCGLRVAEQIEEKGIGNMSGEKLKPLMKKAYNEILRVETVQNIGVLDTHNNYEPPDCMKNNSMKNVTQHFFYEKFTACMKERLRDGSRGNYGSGKFGFYTALREQDKLDKESNKKEDGGGKEL